MKKITPLLITLSLLSASSTAWSKATDIAHNCGLDRVRLMERGVAYRVAARPPLDSGELARVAAVLHDRMTESVVYDMGQARNLFEHHEPAALSVIDVMGGGKTALTEANVTLGLALSDDEIEYLLDHFTGHPEHIILKRGPV